MSDRENLQYELFSSDHSSRCLLQIYRIPNRIQGKAIKLQSKTKSLLIRHCEGNSPKQSTSSFFGNGLLHSVRNDGNPVYYSNPYSLILRYKVRSDIFKSEAAVLRLPRFRSNAFFIISFSTSSNDNFSGSSGNFNSSSAYSSA